jgi:hypothetical protein
MSADVCRARRGELAVVALGQAEADERTRVLAHVDACPACRELLEELQVAARALPLAALEHLLADREPQPSGDLVERIAAQARVERAALAGTRRRHRRRRAAGLLAGAAAVVVFAVGGFLIARDRGAVDLEPFAVVPTGADVRFGLTANDQGTQIVLQQRGLDPNRIYWMWLADQRGERYTAGTFRGGADTSIKMQSALPLDETVRVWCTDAKQDVVLDKWIER